MGGIVNLPSHIKMSGKHVCNECNFVSGLNSGLQYHKKTKHEKVIYECDQCLHKATTLGSLATHKQSKHEGVIYECNLCEYRATQQCNLTRSQSIYA